MTAGPFDPHIALIVEGPGDHGAVPVLLRKFLHEIQIFADVLSSPLAANGLGNLTKPGGLEKFLLIAASRPGCRAVVVVVDADRECIKDVVDGFRDRINIALPVLFVLADSNFEDWLYASIESLPLSAPGTYDSAKSGKAAIASGLGGDAYTKPLHQPKLAANVDFGLARPRSRSLDRALTRFEALVLETSLD